MGIHVVCSKDLWWDISPPNTISSWQPWEPLFLLPHTPTYLFLQFSIFPFFWQPLSRKSVAGLCSTGCGASPAAKWEPKRTFKEHFDFLLATLFPLSILLTAIGPTGMGAHIDVKQHWEKNCPLKDTTHNWLSQRYSLSKCHPLPLTLKKAPQPFISCWGVSPLQTHSPHKMSRYFPTWNSQTQPDLVSMISPSKAKILGPLFLRKAV